MKAEQLSNHFKNLNPAQKFQWLMTCEDQKVVTQLGWYVDEALKSRK
jgi:hypothetical protein